MKEQKNRQPKSGSGTKTAKFINLCRTGILGLITAWVLLAVGVVPVGAASSLGNADVGTLQDSGNANFLNGSKVTTATGMNIVSMSAYVGEIDAASTSRSFQLAIYTDSGGTPATLLANSAIGTLVANSWNSLPINAALQPNTRYWLMYNTNGRTDSANNLYYNGGSDGIGAYKTASVAFGGWPTTFGSANLNNAAYSLYVAEGPNGGGQRDQIGEWSPVMDWPLVAIHATLLKTAKVLVWDDEEHQGVFGVVHPQLWDPVSLAFTDTPVLDKELFCAGHVSLADGRVFTAGGHKAGGGEEGIKSTYVYDADANTWTQGNDMAYDRWYPTLTKLGDGRVVIASGQVVTGAFADTPEIYDPGTGLLATVPSINTTQLREEEYPANFHLPDGKILAISTEHGPVQLLDTDANNWTNVNNTPVLLGSAVQYRPGKILMSGGAPAFQMSSVKQAALLDMNAPAPMWRATKPMSVGRYMHNLVMLPTGDVLAVGGSSIAYEQEENGTLPAEIWDPTTEAWTTVAALSVPRNYHSTALLLPDGRVLAAGGGHNHQLTSQFSAQVYSPPYLFKGSRPIITGAPDTVPYGAFTFTVNSPDAANIASVSLIALGSVTHSIDMNQFYTAPAFKAGGGQLTVTVPQNGNQVPPGYYMLFIVNASGVPSMAKMLKIGDATPTPITSTSGLSSIGSLLGSG